jgi:4-hydroxybenzoate polyprenyltransferase
MHQRSQVHVAWLSALPQLVMKMLRFRTALLLLLFVAVADAATKTNGAAYNPRLLLVIAALAAWYVCSTSINDLADEQIDKINLVGNAERPLANGKTVRRSLWTMAGAAAALALLLAACIDAAAAGLILAGLLLSLVYSFPPLRLSARGIIAPLALPVGYVLLPFLLVRQVNGAEYSRDFLLLLGAVYMSFSARIILKDFRDIRGDAQFGKHTFLVRHGVRATCMVSALFWLIGFGLLAVRFAAQPVIPVLGALVIVAILTVLYTLARTDGIPHQLQYVGLVGRLSNGVAMLILGALYQQFNPSRHLAYNLLLPLLAGFIAMSCWILYEPAIRRLDAFRYLRLAAKRT